MEESSITDYLHEASWVEMMLDMGYTLAIPLATTVLAVNYPQHFTGIIATGVFLESYYLSFGIPETKVSETRIPQNVYLNP
jgi:hypothetical protein